MQISDPKILWLVKRKAVKRTFVATLDRISAVYLNETCGKPTDRRFIASARLSRTYILLHLERAVGHRIYRAACLFGLKFCALEWPAVMEWCHGEYRGRASSTLVETLKPENGQSAIFASSEKYVTQPSRRISNDDVLINTRAIVIIPVNCEAKYFDILIKVLWSDVEKKISKFFFIET